MGTKKNIVLIVMLLITMLASVSMASAAITGIDQKGSFEFGIGTPTGGNSSDYYGSTWVNLRYSRALVNNDSSKQSVSLGVQAGSKSREFYVSGANSSPTASFTARLFSLSYDYTKKTNSPLSYGAGLGVYLVNTEATYDAEDGYYWTSNGEQTISLDKTGMAFAPKFFAAYQIKERFGVELSYTLINTKLSGNTSGRNYLPSVPDVNLGGIISLSANMKL